MTELIKDWIADQGEEKGEWIRKVHEYHTGIDFANGLTKGIEIAEGFSEWTTNGGWTYNSDDNIWRRWAEECTTSQLLETYLKTLEK